MERENHEERSLAKSLGGAVGECPLPSAHDKLAEAHYFIHEMLENYHHPHEFRYSLSGFLQAARSTTLMLQSDLSSRQGFAEWYAEHQRGLATSPDLQLLNRLRVRIVHQDSLVPASFMFAGYLKYGKPKLGFEVPLNPMRDSLEALIDVRGHFTDFAHPHRAWIGEELGIRRKWSLREIEGRELVQFCIDCWKYISEVIAAAHTWAGATLEPKMTCEEEVGEAQSLGESQIFPEILRAWDGPPTEVVTPIKDELLLLSEPTNEAKRLHVVKAPGVVKGWLTRNSPYRPRDYASMLVYSIGEKVVTKETCVFLNVNDAVIVDAPPEPDIEA